jgi:protein arginine kinase activator
MMCEICGKNPATVHLTELIDDKTTELHLCEECAREKGAQIKTHFGLADLLAGLADFGMGLKDVEESTQLKCPSCGLTYRTFRKVGRLGCGECYGAFRQYLAILLKRIHGSTIHVGKIPTGMVPDTSLKSELQGLKAKLHQAIDAEAFEEAARLRDRIRELEGRVAKRK